MAAEADEEIAQKTLPILIQALNEGFPVEVWQTLAALAQRLNLFIYRGADGQVRYRPRNQTGTQAKALRSQEIPAPQQEPGPNGAE